MRRLVVVLFFMLIVPTVCHAGIPGFMKAWMGTIEGQITLDGTPIESPVVAFFDKKKGPPPTVHGARRIPESLSRADEQGVFKVKLLPATYFVGILLRPKSGGPGPPRPGEKFYYAVDENYNLKTFTVPKKGYVNVGVVQAGIPEDVELKNVFRISGRLVDDKGKPVQEAVVMARMRPRFGKPNYVSEPSDENGRFSLLTPPNQKYYLVARETMRGARPAPGSLLGIYGTKSQAGATSPQDSMTGASPPPGVMGSDDDPGAPIAVSGMPGELLEDIEIILFKVPDPAEIKAGIQSTADAPHLEAGTEINNILFGSNDSVLTQESFIELKEWAAFIKGKDGVSVEITGHTDSTGPAAYNKELSIKRAQAVADYFIQQGVSAEKLKVIGMGEEQPVASNATPQGQKENRRVEIKFSGLKFAQPRR